MRVQKGEGTTHSGTRSFFIQWDREKGRIIRRGGPLAREVFLELLEIVRTDTQSGDIEQEFVDYFLPMIPFEDRDYLLPHILKSILSMSVRSEWEIYKQPWWKRMLSLS